MVVTQDHDGAEKHLLPNGIATAIMTLYPGVWGNSGSKPTVPLLRPAHAEMNV